MIPCNYAHSQVASLSLSGLGSSLIWIHLLAILVVTNTWGRSTVAATFPGADPDNLAVNSARDTVLQLKVHLGNSVFREY